MKTTTQASKVSLRRVLRLFAPYRRRLLLIILLIGLASLISLAVPLLVRDLFDVALPQRRAGLLAALSIGMISASVVGSVISVLENLISTTVGQRVMHDLRVGIYSHLQQMSLAFYTRTRNGEVQSRIASDIGAMQATVTTTASSLVSSLTTVTTSVVALLILDWRLASVSLSMLPLFVLISRRIGEMRKKITRRRQRQMAAMTSLVEESLSVGGIVLSRTMGRSGELADAFERESRAMVDLQIQSATAGRWRQALIQTLMASMPVLIYWSAGTSAAHGLSTLSTGTLIAYVSLQQGLFGPSLQLMGIGISLQSSLALFERVFEYLDLPVTIQEASRPIALGKATGHVRFENVEFSYSGGERTLREINLDIPAGGSIAIVGGTGAGKSTLGHLMARLYDVTGGRITIDGRDIRDLSFDSVAANVGVVSQDTYLFHASIAANLRFGRTDATDEELIEAAMTAHIHDFITSLPDGYETMVGERGQRLSGGERQRLAIARTLLRDPSILVLDEATSALDNRTERSVQSALDLLARGRTTITIAHRLSTVRNADEIVVLDRGSIVERGTHEELISIGGYYFKLNERDLEAEFGLYEDVRNS